VTPAPPPPDAGTAATAEASSARELDGPPVGHPAAVALPRSELQLVRARGPVRGVLPLLGPAFVAAVAYVDPGNFATNIQGGAKYGYLLLWVVLAANLIAMLVQSLSAKVGLATGHNLPELCREHLPRPVSWGLWVQAELVAMATDLAEFIGAALALNLLFGVPLFAAGVLTAIVAFAILALQVRGYRRFELAIAGMLGVVLLGFLYDTLRIGFDAGAAAQGFVPSFQGSDSVLLGAGILGATVMPHVIYLHSALTQRRVHARDARERLSLVRFTRLDVVLALGIAGIVNIAMLVAAASLFHASGDTGVDTIERAHSEFARLAGTSAGVAFGLALLASGFASSSVGTYAGQVVMQGFIARTIPLVVRRAVTMTPALIVLALGLDPTRSLVISQVALSFGIPFALVPLVLLTRRRDVMGPLVNHWATTAAAFVVAALIIALNVFLLGHTLLG
jgi:manganese transport protein